MNFAFRHLLVCCGFAATLTISLSSFGADQQRFVSPQGSDQSEGTSAGPFRTLHRAQQAARELVKNGSGDVVINLAAGDYRLDRPLELTEADSGRDGRRVVYRSSEGPGRARILASVPLTGWELHRDGIWKVKLPASVVFHTLYENGQRAHKARFPNREFQPAFPTALDRYLVTVGGTPIQAGKELTNEKTPGWLMFAPEDASPVTHVSKMRIHIYGRGKCDWVREVFPVTSIDAENRRLNIDGSPFGGVGIGARYFLEDEAGFLDAPGEFFVNDAEQTLYYFPVGKAHPDTLGIAYPVLNRLVQLHGKSRAACAEHIVLEGLSLEETDNSPPQALWAYAGLSDGALIWMHNTHAIEIRNCHLKNSGRSGVMMIGHNTGNSVSGCLIEHTGLNGISLCNRFSAPDGKGPTLDRCERNHIRNCRLHHIGELHSYAECVTLFNVNSNEIDHCELSDCVRYGVTLRGNTGAQYGPPVSTNHPPCRDNWIHHLHVRRCGQDGGDMGALHAAAVNNPGGGNVNTFEQIVVEDTRATPSMKDWPDDGIFLDWPKMSMDQVFRHIQILRSQGKQFRSHGPDNEASAVTENVSWKPGFRPDLMDFDNIGVTQEFPVECRPQASGP